jgi:hypothetical protein
MASTNTPEKTSISPSTIKRGIGRRTNVLIEENMLCINMDIPAPPQRM